MVCRETAAAPQRSLTLMSSRPNNRIWCDTSTAFSPPRFSRMVEPTIRIVSSDRTTSLTWSTAMMDSTCSDSCGLQPVGKLFAAKSNLPVCCSFFDRTFTWSEFSGTNGHFGVCRYKSFFLEEAMAELAWKIVGWILVHALPRSSDDF